MKSEMPQPCNLPCDIGVGSAVEVKTEMQPIFEEDLLLNAPEEAWNLLSSHWKHELNRSRDSLIGQRFNPNSCRLTQKLIREEISEIEKNLRIKQKKSGH